MSNLRAIRPEQHLLSSLTETDIEASWEVGGRVGESGGVSGSVGIIVASFQMMCLVCVEFEKRWLWLWLTSETLCVVFVLSEIA